MFFKCLIKHIILHSEVIPHDIFCAGNCLLVGAFIGGIQLNNEIEQLNKKAEDYSKTIDSLLEEVGKVIVGQKDTVKKVVVALSANGHVLLEGMPGLAKTMMIKTLADTLDAGFKRIQLLTNLTN